MSIVENAVEKFTYSWEIENPWFCTQPMGQCIESPKFCIPQFWNTEWNLIIFPHGYKKEFDQSTSCFIKRFDDIGPDSVEINYTITSNSFKRVYYLYYSFKKNTDWGYGAFLPRPLHDYENSVIVILEMSLRSENLTASEENNSSSKNVLTFPIKCFTQSKFLYGTKCIQRFIDPLIRGTCSKMTIPLILQENYPSLIIDLQIDSEEMALNIGLMNGVFEENLILICEISITNNDGRLIYSSKRNIKFIAGTDEILSLKTDISKSYLKTYLSDSYSNKIKFKGDFAISMGQTLSEIVNVERIKVSNIFPTSNEYIPSNEMFRLYKERTLCDFTLKVGDGTFDVHKVVLGAASPVFAAMFTSEMKENKNDEVDIVDVDKETVDEMVSFMYTGSVKEWEYVSAKKLFIAADKYQILPLMDLARNAMISLMNCDVICDILSTADNYNDKKLKEEAVKFIKFNKTNILNSSKWRTFETVYASSAAEILRQVFL